MKLFTQWLFDENYYANELARLIVAATKESGGRGSPDWAERYVSWMLRNGGQQILPMAHPPIVAKLLKQAASEMVDNPTASWPEFAAQYILRGLNNMTRTGGRHDGRGFELGGIGMPNNPYPAGMFAAEPEPPDPEDWWRG